MLGFAALLIPADGAETMFPHAEQKQTMFKK